MGVPVVCLDTCTLLDLMRTPTRESIRVNERQAALDLLAELEGGNTLAALLADQVEREFQEHVQSVEDETTQAIERLKKHLHHVDTVVAVYGSKGTASLAYLDDHAARARKIAERWIDAATQAPEDDVILSRAFRRMNLARTPARKGKDSMKDCVVVETYLKLVGELRAGGLTSPVVFVSSNTKDYAGEIGSTLKPDLAMEFALLKMEYAPNLAAAKHQLGL